MAENTRQLRNYENCWQKLNPIKTRSLFRTESI